MDLFEVNALPLLSPDEKEECKVLKIPKYYLLYLKTTERGQGIEELKGFIKQGISPVFSRHDLTGQGFKELRKFIKQRISSVFFSKQELTGLADGIVDKIKELVKRYGDGYGQKIKNLEREFDSEIFSLAKEIMANRKPKIKVKSKTKITFNFISEDKQELNPVIILAGGERAIDKYCLYFKECNRQAINYGGRLNCSPCEHQNI
ncbi:hypothetical protein KAR28_06680 [Candidatus Parcubacteria bacterium]|nr:hypothetical protein [Candidatus Parcubacteria bacterium]